MSETDISTDFAILPETRHKIDAWCKKFPVDKKQSAVLYALTLVQRDNDGWLSVAAMDAVADYLDMPKIIVYEVATFYSMFELNPVGKHVLSICTNVSCWLNGAQQVVAHLEKKLGIKLGETTPDGRITLKPVECLAACDLAPMLQHDEKNIGGLTVEKIDDLLAELSDD